MIWTIVILFFVAIIIAKLFLQKRERVLNLSLFRKKERVMNESEQALFINLQQVLGGEYVVLSKVRIEDFVEVKKNQLSSNEEYGARGRIKSRHVDFLICDRATTKPLLAIELDGKSHSDLRRQDRDNFIDELYKSINLPVEHIPVGGNFLETANKIKGILIM